MKFALVEGQRLEAYPNLKGVCAACGNPTLTKCGSFRVHHWAHYGQRRCDPWWETETEWHRTWKNQFPSEWQEVVHRSETGELHIADVTTINGWILEFQHSNITPEERKAREDFYGKIFWVVDGARTLQSKNRFLFSLADGGAHRHFPEIRTVFTSTNNMLKIWSTSTTHVLFDFGDETLWWLWSGQNTDWSYFISISKNLFIDFFQKSDSTPLDAFIAKYNQEFSKQGAFPSLADYSFFKKSVLD